MGFLLSSWLYNTSDWYRFGSNWMSDVLGNTQVDKKKESNQVQIDYNEYMKRGNQRAYNDWQRLYGSKGLEIRYPELSYPGAIAGYNAGISSAYLSNDIADANYRGSLPYRLTGIYGVAGRVSRYL